MNSYSELVDAAIELCRGAGDILLSGFRSKSTVINYKSRTDIVTNIDNESEEYIVSGIKKFFPRHSIVAEEGRGSESDSGFVWYVDPLDATNNFAHGIPFFCISIGIYSKIDESMVAGVVFDPVHNEMFHALRGGGAYLNGLPVHVSHISDIGIALLATGFPYAKEDMERNNLSEFNRFLPGIQCIRRLGSAALDLCYVSAGRLDGYWEPMLKSWDTAAGSLIVQEAGGTVTKYDGSRFDPLFPQIVASNGRIHSRMIDILNSR